MVPPMPQNVNFQILEFCSLSATKLGAGVNATRMFFYHMSFEFITALECLFVVPVAICGMTSKFPRTVCFQVPFKLVIALKSYGAV